MLGKAEYGCKGDASKITASVRIQVKSGGQWFTANSWRSETTVKPPNQKKLIIQTFSMPCARGTYRTQATIRSWAADGTSMTVQNTDYAYSKEVKNPCD